MHASVSQQHMISATLIPIRLRSYLPNRLENARGCVRHLRLCNISIRVALHCRLPSNSSQESDDEDDRPLAFRSKASDEAQQWAFCLAADYSDEWTCVRRPDGSIKSAHTTCV